MKLPYDTVNPVALKAPIAPHIAAQQEGKTITLARLAGYVRGALNAHKADLVLIEGAGGWRVPLNDREMLAGLAKELELPVIQVVGMKLGCINHALLTAEAIEKDGLRYAGTIANDGGANCFGQMAVQEENLLTLRQHLPGAFAIV